ncbi:hypothetical protein E2C01_017686 [Portunus trituberculatus]|uniref:Uncharacterized protein n=1 Tax=Portunus trituberculatus TaxID=210409 RepID=A0A5B7DU72_PORTR|nr:hypothetical protein [Portunus trituberculatus]
MMVVVVVRTEDDIVVMTHLHNSPAFTCSGAVSRSSEPHQGSRIVHCLAPCLAAPAPPLPAIQDEGSRSHFLVVAPVVVITGHHALFLVAIHFVDRDRPRSATGVSAIRARLGTYWSNIQHIGAEKRLLVPTATHEMLVVRIQLGHYQEDVGTLSQAQVAAGRGRLLREVSMMNLHTLEFKHVFILTPK